MKPSNRDGDPVDPVPYLVVTSVVALVAVSFLPGYGMALGLSAWIGVWFAVVVTVAFAAVAYHRMVHTYRPMARRDVPPGLRLRKVVYGALVACGLLVGLSLPRLVS